MPHNRWVIPGAEKRKMFGTDASMRPQRITLERHPYKKCTSFVPCVRCCHINVICHRKSGESRAFPAKTAWNLKPINLLYFFTYSHIIFRMVCNSFRYRQRACEVDRSVFCWKKMIFARFSINFRGWKIIYKKYIYFLRSSPFDILRKMASMTSQFAHLI